MPKALSLSGIIVGGLLALLFLVDLVPNLLNFGMGWMTNIGFVIVGLMLAYMGWSTLQENE